MARIRITKRFDFEMAHTLLNYDGMCKNIHGHSYLLDITLAGEPLENIDHPKNGMVLDFGDLKKLIHDLVISRFDHALMVNSAVPAIQMEILKNSTERILVVDFQPTSENMVVYIAGLIRPHLPEHIDLFSVRLYETQTSYAEWYASDNQDLMHKI